MERKLDDHEIHVTVSEEAECKRVISVEIARERFDSEKERVVDGMVTKVSLPGFRKGKVPHKIVRQRFSGEILSETLQSILPVAYGHVVTSEKLEPIGEPIFSEIDHEGDESLKFKIDVEVMPEFDITEYKNLRVPEETIELKDEEIDQVLGNLQERYADYEEVDRPAVTTDLVIIDYVPVNEDGTTDEKGRAENYPVQLGSGQLFPAFEQAIAGKAVGSTARSEIDYPDNFEPKHLAGKKVTFEFTIKEIKEKRIPPLDDDFAGRVDETFSSVDDLKADIRKRLEQEKAKEARRRREEAAIDLLIEKNQFEIPRSMHERFKKELEQEDARRRESMGVGPEEDEEKRKKIDELLSSIALRNIRRYFVLDHIAGKEGIEIADEEIQAELESISQGSGRPIEDVRKVFKKGGEPLSNLKGRLREKRVFGEILGKA